MFTLVGDPHAKPDNLDKINALFDMIEELGNDCIILGDLLDTKEVVRGKCLNTYVRRLKASKLKFWILVGNHDWFNLECQEHSLEILKEIPNVTVVDEPLDHKNFLFLPYTHKTDLLRQWMQELGKGRVVFCHADIKGFDYGNGKISEAGLTVEDLLGGPKAVYSGHYHKYQKEGKITYIGTPFSHSFGEANQLKYIGVYNTLTNKLELIETPFPRHISLEINCDKQKRLQDNHGDILRVILTGSQEYIDLFQRQEGVKYLEQPTSVVKPSVIDETETPEVQFSKWAIDIKGYSAKLLKKGLEILADV